MDLIVPAFKTIDKDSPIFSSKDVLDVFAPGKEVVEGYKTIFALDGVEEFYTSYDEIKEAVIKSENGIMLGEDYIRIYHDQKEIVGWTMQEWIEDPTVVTSIFEAIIIVANEGTEELARILEENNNE